MRFGQFTAMYAAVIETSMTEYVKNLDSPKILREAMLYSITAGGKRLRPMLVLAVLEAYGKDPMLGLGAACAAEMIHTYSLIHDDLPSMDNDALRRGKPTSHMVFGEAFATLAGDAMQPAAFQLIADNLAYTDAQKVALVSELASAAGATGMVGGQVADIEAENREISLTHMEKIHELKTGRLIGFSIIAGGILADAKSLDLNYLREFARHFGIAFQIQDDILDVEGNQAMIGKAVGSDAEKNKSTYPALLTLDGAKEKLATQVKLAKETLTKVSADTSMLEEIVDLFANRES